MNEFKPNIYIIFFSIGLLTACGINKNQNHYHLFNNIEVTRNLTNGDKNFQINSQLVNYNTETNIVRGKDAEILVYRKNKPIYKIKGKTYTALNQKNIILMEGDISVTRFQMHSQIPNIFNRTITGDYLKWNITESTIIVKDFPENYFKDRKTNPTTYICTIDSGGCKALDIPELE